MLADIYSAMFVWQFAAIAKAHKQIAFFRLLDRRFAFGVYLRLIALGFSEHARFVFERHVFVKVGIARAYFANKTSAVLRVREAVDAFDKSLRASRPKHQTFPEMCAAYIGARWIRRLIYLYDMLEFEKALFRHLDFIS